MQKVRIFLLAHGALVIKKNGINKIYWIALCDFATFPLLLGFFVFCILLEEPFLNFEGFSILIFPSSRCSSFFSSDNLRVIFLVLGYMDKVDGKLSNMKNSLKPQHKIPKLLL